MKQLTTNNEGEIKISKPADLLLGEIYCRNGYGQNEHSHERKVIYEIVNGSIWGTQYKWVNLDKPERGLKSAHEIKHALRIFGIGSYYNDNDIASADEITNALEKAINEEIRSSKLKEADTLLQEQISEEGKKVLKRICQNFNLNV